MIRHIHAEERHVRTYNWLTARWLFSFDSYYDKTNESFGALRVFNHDTVMPKSGFPPHPHRDFEIITIPLRGSVTHEDSLGSKETVGVGYVQFMSAGKGAVHSEWNHADEELELCQIWFMPRAFGGAPRYETKEVSFPQAGLHAVLSGNGEPGALAMTADATLFLGGIDTGEMGYPLSPGKGVFLYLLSGELFVEDVVIKPGDQLRVTERASLLLRGKAAKFVFIETTVS